MLCRAQVDGEGRTRVVGSSDAMKSYRRALAAKWLKRVTVVVVGLPLAYVVLADRVFRWWIEQRGGVCTDIGGDGTWSLSQLWAALRPGNCSYEEGLDWWFLPGATVLG